MDDDYSSNNITINEEFQQHPGLNPSPPLPPGMYLLCARYFTTRSVTFTPTWELREIAVTLAVRRLRWAPVSTDGSVHGGKEVGFGVRLLRKSILVNVDPEESQDLRTEAGTPSGF